MTKTITLWTRLLLTAGVLLSAIGMTSPSAAASGEETFKKKCGACHSVGGGKLTGPDLKGVTERRTEAWLLQFVKSPQKLADSGDATAKALIAEFGFPMPDQDITDADLKAVLAYIAGGGGGGGGGAAAPAAPAAPPSAADIELGAKLFQGLVRFEKSGPACNSCHHVKNDAVIGGGVLARELTTVFTRMGAPGTSAIIGQPPFPVMEAAYKGRDLTPAETKALVAFLQDVAAKEAMQTPVDYGNNLLIGGSGLFLVLACLYGLIWRRRKQLPVNHEVFARQVKSQ